MNSPAGETASWELPRGFLRIVFLGPAVLIGVAWLWSYTVWRFSPNVSAAGLEAQRHMLHVGTDLPFNVCGGLAALIGIGGAIHLAVNRHGGLAVVVFLYALIAVVAVFVGSVAFINFKPPGW